MLDRIETDLEELILSHMRRAAYKPLTAEELLKALNLEPNPEFFEKLAELEKQGKIVQTRKLRYGVPEKLNLVVGRIQGHPNGFAFIIPDRAGEEDVFVSPANLNGAMHNDRVIARITSKGDLGVRREGEVIRILERANTLVVGTYSSSKHFGFVIPDETRISQDFFIARGNEHGARSGDKVVIRVTQWPQYRMNPEGEVVQIIGRKGAPGIDMESIIWKHKLPREFPPDVERQLKDIPDEVRPEDMQGREDLRNLLMVTIDGEDAKDLDDAVSLEMLPDGLFRLGVHIADVGHYVPLRTPLDKEAYKRATSVYLVDRVIPMLPPKLSNGICSLNPRVDRLALSVMMDIDEEGNVRRHQIYESVINSNERMTYTDVKRMLVDKDEELLRRYHYLVQMLQNMERLCRILRARRLKRGAIDFDIPEAKVILDDRGRPLEIKKAERSIADRIIEEFMLVANETVAEAMFWMEIPFVYRVHEEPAEEKLVQLQKFLATFGYGLKGINKIHPRALQKIVEQVKGRPEERVINTVMLRTMKQARYSEENLGHFGLAAKYYCHFTSPIRRYPDLVIHRIIKSILKSGSLPQKELDRLKKFVPAAAVQSSERERAAMEAERESADLKKVEFMLDKVGQVFEGIISSVTSFGLFVELDNLVEGLVHITTLTDDFYEYDEENYRLVGQHTRKIYRIGDQVRVRVERVNPDERQVDFELVDGGGPNF
ncbi:ribonuclease R [Thermincola ferriacetica]|uniref:Ribonuclease R n=1 Tax=Thermincola ferriacetica TaxID=281456 RepID=A0A0L6W379_9FIRM|nr:ribonuclease R [Thermincola ferriacetica]KNZ69990.1 ribonuclease R [Thermincola ferriacetica]